MTLEEIFAGKKTKIAINRDRKCKPCEGRGGKEGAVQKCTTCRGRGMVTKMQQIGPGMYTQSNGPCDECMGKGEVIDEANKCKECRGKKVQREKKIIDVEIDKGSPNNSTYTFHGEADELPGQEAGDVIIVVQEQPHKKYKRKGADLIMEMEITLLQALTGVDFVHTHLDGTKIRIKNNPGEVIKPDSIMTVEEKGLPFYRKSFAFGNLYVKFVVSFPKKMGPTELKLLQGTLGAAKADTEMEDDSIEVAKLAAYDEKSRNTQAHGGQDAEDDDEEDDDPRGGQRVQCNQ